MKQKEKKLGYGEGLTTGGGAGGNTGIPPTPQPKYPRQTYLGGTKKSKK